MDEAISQMFNPQLMEFVSVLVSERIYPSKVSPDIVAERFVHYFDVVCPINLAESSKLLSTLSLTNVVLNPELENTANIRGLWANFEGKCRVVIDASRPMACLIKSLLHEIAEQMLTISYALQDRPRELSNKNRELWANRFAAMCKMPPDLFIREAAADGWNLRHLAERFEDTIAGVGRQIRDIVAMNEVFYSCRFDIVTKPEKACPKLVHLVQQSQSTAVLVHDVVRTTSVCNRNRRGALPKHIVPNSNHYRVVHPAFLEMTPSSRPIYIPRIDGAASLELKYRDLFGYNDLAVVVQWYGSRRKVKGFFLAAIHPDNVAKIETQLGDLNVDVRRDIDWLFSTEKQIKKRIKKKRPQPGLTILESNGTTKDMAELPYDWPKPLKLLTD